MAIADFKVNLTKGPLLTAILECQSALIVDRDKYKLLYESSQAALTQVLEQVNEQAFQLQLLRHTLDCVKADRAIISEVRN